MDLIWCNLGCLIGWIASGVTYYQGVFTKENQETASEDRKQVMLMILLLPLLAGLDSLMQILNILSGNCFCFSW